MLNFKVKCVRILALILFFLGICFAQIEETIYCALVDSADTTESLPNYFISSHGLTPDGSQTGFNMANSRIVDISIDAKTMLFYNYLIDSSVIVHNYGDDQTIDTIKLNGSKHRFSYDKDLIIYSNYPELYKVSIINDTETLIANTYANLHSRNIHFTLSPNRDELIYLKQTGWTDSLDMIKVNIQSMETEVITRISYTMNFDLQWAQDGYVYFNIKDSTDISQLYKIHNLSVEDEPTQLTFFDYDCNLISTAQTNFDIIIFKTTNDSMQTELWVHDVTLNENSFIRTLTDNSNPYYQALSPDGSKVVIGSTIMYWWFFISGSLDIFDLETGNHSNISEDYSGGPIFWINNSTQASTFNSQTLNFYKLHDAYPNPFNPITTLSYNLPKDELVNIKIYDIMGRIINDLISSKQSSGFNSVQWNATDNFGQPVSAGVYIYQIEAGNFTQTKKMLLLK